MKDIETLMLVLAILVLLLICVQIWRKRREGKSWREIGEEYAEHFDPTGLFRGRRSRKDHDDDSPTGSDGPDTDFD